MKLIFVRTSFNGTHNYPKAPQEVSFLQHEHRHVFHVEAMIEVFHDDRELEFIMVKNRIDAYLRNRYGVVDYRLQFTSCEMIANDIIELLEEAYCRETSRTIKVTVSEDGENGAVVTTSEVDTSKPTRYIAEQMAQAAIQGIKDEMGIMSPTRAMYGGHADEQIPVPYAMDDYQAEINTAIRPYKDQRDELLHYAVGISEEVGELASHIKHICYGEQVDVDAIKDELGDILWYVTSMARLHGLALSDVAAHNRDKLLNRYPNGKFDERRSQQRHSIDRQMRGE